MFQFDKHIFQMGWFNHQPARDLFELVFRPLEIVAKVDFCSSQGGLLLAKKKLCEVGDPAPWVSFKNVLRENRSEDSRDPFFFPDVGWKSHGKNTHAFVLRLMFFFKF